MLTPAQLLTFRNAIKTHPEFWNGTQIAESQVIADYYNSTASPAVPLWKPVVTIQELNNAIVWADMMALSQEKQLCFQTMIWANQIDMTDVQVRGGINSIFGGTMPVGTKNGINQAGRRSGSYLEALFAVVDGVANVSAVFGYKTTPEEVLSALTTP